MKDLIYYTVDELSKMLKISYRSLLKHIKSGELEAANISTGRNPVYRISHSAINKFLETRRGGEQ